MGNTTSATKSATKSKITSQEPPSATKSKITSQEPPSYAETQLLEPLTPEYINHKLALFKEQQIMQYEQNLQITEKLTIKYINTKLETMSLSKKIVRMYVSLGAVYHKTIAETYRSAEMDELYVQKHYDFICKMYSGFEIKLTEDLPTKKTFEISLK